MRKNYLILLLICCALGNIKAQQIEQPFKDIVPPSPTVAALMRFEEVPVSLYTGAPNISIPLFQKAIGGGMAINLQLGYNTSGIRVNERSGWVGTGWSFFAGGTISRTVKDLPDEINNTGTKVGAFHNGLHNWDNFTPAQTDEFLWKANRGEEKYDSQWDVFQFNFMGKTGRFSILRNSSGGLEAKLISRNEQIKIDFTADANGVISEFVLTDAMGYKYVFGTAGVIESTSSEVISTSVSQWDVYSNSGNINVTPTVSHSAWHLVSIKRPNDQELCSFSYQAVNESYTTPPNEKGHEVLTTLNTALFDNTPDGLTNRGYILPKYTSSHNAISVGSQKLQQINFSDGTSVTFDLTSDHPEMGGGAYIDRVNIRDIGGAVLQYYDLLYTTTPPGRLFLTGIDHYAGVEKQQYVFKYNNMHELPAFGSPNQDQWGYYNYHNNNTPVNPDLYDFADPNKVTTGVLTKIDYPIGGSKEFVYESNTFSYVGDQPATLPANQDFLYGAGIRIQEIKFTENGATKISTTYSYDEIGGNGKSSGSFDGVLLGDKNYSVTRKHLLANNQAYTVDYQVYEDRHVLFSTNDRNHFVGYKHVIKRQTGNGYVLSTLTSPRDFPSFPPGYGYPFADVPDQSFKTGLVIKEEVFNEAGNRLTETVNTYEYPVENVVRSIWMFENQFENCEYNRLYNDYDDYIAPINSTQSCGSASTYLGGIAEWEVGTRADLTETTSTQYFPDQALSVPVVSRQTYSYDDTNYQIKSRTDIFKEEGTEYGYRTDFYYPHDYPTEYYEPEEQTALANMISSDNQYNQLVATKHSKLKVGVPLELPKVLNIVANKYSSSGTNDYLLNAYEVAEVPASAAKLEGRYEVLSYDNHGNPLEIRQVNGTSTAYIWGYGKTRMVAQINGATKANVEAILDANYDLGQGGLSPTQETSLRALSDALVVTMEYHPIYGIIRQTDSNGKNTTFEYDAFGRLKLVRDFEGNILSKNEYNLKGLSND